MSEGADTSATAPRLTDPPSARRERGPSVRLGLLIFAIVFQLLTAIALIVVVHLLRGHYEGSTYSTGQQIDATVLGVPGAALAVGVLLAATYNLGSGRHSGLVLRLALASGVLLGVGCLLELALK